MIRRAAPSFVSALPGVALALALTACASHGATAAGGQGAQPSIAPPPADPLPAVGTVDLDGWRLVWADGFDGNRIDPARWGHDVDCWGGGNDERQCYTDRPANSRVADGVLTITARSERWTGPALPPHIARTAADPAATATKSYTSARLTTRGRASWTYGRIVVRALLPRRQGSWPAIWMLPETNAYGGWAASGEIDILETVNLGVPCATCPSGLEDRIFGTLHFGGPPPANRQASTGAHRPDVLDGWHDYGLVWTPDAFVWTYDGVPYARQARGVWHSSGADAAANPSAPFDQPFHLILNLAVGGRWPEGEGTRGVDPGGFPRHLRIDRVAVWQCDAGPAACPLP